MNTAQITHIFWKEYRTQRSIWLGIILIVVVIQVLVWAMMPNNARDPLATLASIGAILSVFYALASAGVLFAGEREEQTYSWLRILPVSSVSLFGGKFLWLVVSWLLAVGISLLTAYLPYWGTELDSDKIGKGLAQFAVMGGGLALWGIFFSMLCQRVYSALALAPLALLLTGGLNSYFPGIAYVLYAAVAIGAVVQGRRWIVEENLAIWTGFGWRSRALTLDAALGSAAEVSPAWRFFRRELWLEWRNARWVALGVTAIMGLMLFFSSATSPDELAVISWFLIVALLPLVYGVSTFRAEQYQSRYRFQSHRGASPAALWTAKHLVWGGLLVVTMLLISFPGWLPMVHRDRLDTLNEMLPVPQNAWPSVLRDRFYDAWQPMMVLSLSMMLWMYAVGHLCSLLIKRSVSAVLVALAVGTVGCVPVFATLFLDVPRSIALVLPATALLLFGLWRTKGWLSERNETHDWMNVFGVLTLSGLVCMTSWVVWRLSELTLPPTFAGFVSFFPAAGLLQIYGFGGGLMLLILLVSLLAYRRRLTMRRLFLGWSVIHVLSGAAYLMDFDTRIEPPSETEIAAFIPSPEALETGDRYRELNLHISANLPGTNEGPDRYDFWQALLSGDLELSDAQLAWLDDNAATLNLLIENTKRKHCSPENLFDSNTWSDQKELAIHNGRAEALLRLSALRQEQNGALEEAWTYHLALLRFYRHYIQNQTPLRRDWAIGHCRKYLHLDLKRWINHSGQTPDRLAQAANEFTTIVGNFDSLSSAFELQATHQKRAVAGNELGSWTSSTNPDFLDWPVFLDQALHWLPWEKQRSQFLLQKVEEHQLQVAKGIRDGQVGYYAPELANSYYHPRTDQYPIWLQFSRHPSWTRKTDHLWHLAETTPIIQAANQEYIEGYGYGPNRSERILIHELTWIQYRRLAVLQMAFRAAELQTGEKVSSLEKLVELKSDPVVGSILKAGENLEGSESKLSGYSQEYEKWQSLLYYDPITSRLFDITTINKFRNPPTD